MLIVQQCGCLEAEYFPLVAVPGLHRRTSQPSWGKNGTKTFGGVAEQTPCKKTKNTIPSPRRRFDLKNHSMLIHVVFSVCFVTLCAMEV